MLGRWGILRRVALAALCAGSPIGVAAWAGPDDLDQALAQLDAPVAVARHEAERWLAARLELQDAPRVALFLRGGSAEARRRVVRALTTDDRHLDLAATLAVDGDDEVARLGGAAVSGLARRWSPTVVDTAVSRLEGPPAWREDLGQELTFDPGRGDLAAVLDRLDRLGVGRAPIVLDPDLDPDVRLSEPAEVDVGELELDWLAALGAVASAHRVEFEVYGHRQDGLVNAEDGHAFVRVHLRGARGGTGAQHLESWVRGVLRPHSPAWNRACAVALARSEWPAALDWLERRWVEGGDPAALEGLLAAAARGRVVPALIDRARIARLLDQVDRELVPAVGAPTQAALGRAGRVARALARVPASDAAGRALAPVLLEGLEEAPPGGRWVRLVALSRPGPADADVTATARAILAAPGPPEVRLAALDALRARGRPSGEAFEVPAPVVLVVHAISVGRGDEVAEALAAVGARPDARAPLGALVEDPATRRLLISWLALAGDAERAARLVVDELDDESLDALADRARSWAGRGLGPAGRALVTAVAALDAPRAAHLLVRSGLATDAEVAAQLDAFEAAVDLDRHELLDLGALAAHPGEGERARALLLDSLVTADDLPDALPAMLRAQAELRRARQEMELSRLTVALNRRVRALDSAVPLGALLPRTWEVQPPTPPRRLLALERDLCL